MNLKPIGSKVVVRPEKAEEVSKGGIVLPDTVSKERPSKGEVVAVGPGKTLENGQREELTVKKGDNVIFSKYAGTEFKIDEQEHLILSESDILAIIE